MIESSGRSGARPGAAGRSIRLNPGRVLFIYRFPLSMILSLSLSLSDVDKIMGGGGGGGEKEKERERDTGKERNSRKEEQSYEFLG